MNAQLVCAECGFPKLSGDHEAGCQMADALSEHWTRGTSEYERRDAELAALRAVADAARSYRAAEHAWLKVTPYAAFAILTPVQETVAQALEDARRKLDEALNALEEDQDVRHP